MESAKTLETFKGKSSETTATPIVMQIASRSPGRLRLRVAHRHRQNGQIEHIANTLKTLPQVSQVQTNVQSGSILIYHDLKDGSLEDISNTLRDLGIVSGKVTQAKTETATDLVNAVTDLNQRVEQATNGVVDLRFLIPFGLGTLAIRQLLARGVQFEMVPWYVLAWYAFDSFIKLHYTSEPQQTAARSDEL